MQVEGFVGVYFALGCLGQLNAAGVHDPPHVQSGPVSRGLVIGWQVRMTWAWLEDRDEELGLLMKLLSFTTDFFAYFSSRSKLY
jgi:hypothetical protein